MNCFLRNSLKHACVQNRFTRTLLTLDGVHCAYRKYGGHSRQFAYACQKFVTEISGNETSGWLINPWLNSLIFLFEVASFQKKNTREQHKDLEPIEIFLESFHAWVSRFKWFINVASQLGLQLVARGGAKDLGTRLGIILGIISVKSQW